MIQVFSLKKSYGSRTLFEDATFAIGAGERIGLVGRNGEGKSTLFRILTDEESIDDGSIHRPKDYTIGYLSQHIAFKEPTVLEEATAALPLNEDGWIETYRAEETLFGLGFTEAQCNLPPQSLSGGFQVRLQLAKVLLSTPRLLLLDEPTNYLDITSIRWLQEFLRTWKGELLIITHDRAFMDSVTTHTIGIHRRRIRKVEGPTTKLYEQIMIEEDVHERTRQKEAKRREQAERFINRFRAQASRAKAVQSRIKTLDKQQRLEALETIEQLDFQFISAPFPGKWMLHTDGLAFSFPKGDELISDLTFSVGKEDRIAIIGPNGKGKTTLLNLLAGELEPTAGSVTLNQNLSMGYFGQTNVDRLDPSLTIEQEVYYTNQDLSRTAVRNICGAMMFEGDDALKKIKVLSGGERARVLLGKVLAKPVNLLLLDEPTNHLDMESIDSLVEAVNSFDGAVVLVTHSEMILRAIATRLIVFDNDEVYLCEGDYDYFLEKYGWSNEQPKGAAKKKPSKKSIRAERAELINARSKEVTPLKHRIEEIEREIVRLEADVATARTDLAEASESGDSARIASLSIAQHQANTEIERLFEELSNLSEQLIQREQQFEEKLAALGEE